MRFAIISDIHSDIHRLNGVLSFLDNQNIRHIYCCGDLVGYGAFPEEVVSRIRTLGILCVSGNHEMALFSESQYKLMNKRAKLAIDSNHDLLSDAALKYLEALPEFLIHNNIRFVHGAPPNSVDEYICYLPDREVKSLFRKFRERITFCGHTHKTALIELRTFGIKRTEEIDYTSVYKLNASVRYIINVGSVSDARDTDAYVSRFVVYDSKEDTIRFCQI